MKNMASGAKTPKIGEKSSIRLKLSKASSKIRQTKILVTRFGDLSFIWAGPAVFFSSDKI